MRNRRDPRIGPLNRGGLSSRKVIYDPSGMPLNDRQKRNAFLEYIDEGAIQYKTPNIDKIENQFRYHKRAPLYDKEDLHSLLPGVHEDIVKRLRERHPRLSNKEARLHGTDYINNMDIDSLERLASNFSSKRMYLDPKNSPRESLRTRMNRQRRLNRQRYY